MLEINSEVAPAKAFHVSEPTLSTKGFVALAAVFLLLALLIIAGEQRFSQPASGRGMKPMHSAATEQQLPPARN